MRRGGLKNMGQQTTGAGRMESLTPTRCDQKRRRYFGERWGTATDLLEGAIRNECLEPWRPPAPDSFWASSVRRTLWYISTISPTVLMAPLFAAAISGSSSSCKYMERPPQVLSPYHYSQRTAPVIPHPSARSSRAVRSPTSTHRWNASGVYIDSIPLLLTVSPPMPAPPSVSPKGLPLACRPPPECSVWIRVGGLQARDRAQTDGRRGVADVPEGGRCRRGKVWVFLLGGGGREGCDGSLLCDRGGIISVSERHQNRSAPVIVGR